MLNIFETNIKFGKQFKNFFLYQYRLNPTIAFITQPHFHTDIIAEWKYFNNNQILRIFHLYRTFNRNNWRSRFIHRKRVNHKFNMRYIEFTGTTSIHFLESQQCGECRL